MFVHEMVIQKMWHRRMDGWMYIGKGRGCYFITVVVVVVNTTTTNKV